MKHSSLIKNTLLSAIGLGLSQSAFAVTDEEFNALQERLNQTDEEFNALQAQFNQLADQVDENSQSDGSSTTIGGYGELHYNNLSNGEGDQKKEIDFHRFVLFIGHEFNDKIRFFSELEVEHATIVDTDDGSSPGSVAIEQALTVDTQNRVGLLGCPVDRNLVAVFLAIAGSHQRQVGRVAVILSVGIDATEHLGPRGVRLNARAEAQDRARCRVDIEYVAVLVDDDHTVVDIAQDGQHRDVGLGQARLQPMPLHRVLQDDFLRLDRDVVDADIALSTCPHGRDSAMLALPRGQCHNRVGLQHADQFGQ